MQRQTKSLQILLTTILVASLCAGSVTKVLQNGKDGYTGCIDTYTFSFYNEDNYSTVETLFNHNCQN